MILDYIGNLEFLECMWFQGSANMINMALQWRSHQAGEISCWKGWGKLWRHTIRIVTRNFCLRFLPWKPGAFPSNFVKGLHSSMQIVGVSQPRHTNHRPVLSVLSRPAKKELKTYWTSGQGRVSDSDCYLCHVMYRQPLTFTRSLSSDPQIQRMQNGTEHLQPSIGGRMGYHIVWQLQLISKHDA